MGRRTNPHGGEPDEERDDVGQHVVGVADERERVGDVADDDLHEEERGRHRDHAEEAARLARVATHPRCNTKTRGMMTRRL